MSEVKVLTKEIAELAKKALATLKATEFPLEILSELRDKYIQLLDMLPEEIKETAKIVALTPKGAIELDYYKILDILETAIETQEVTQELVVALDILSGMG